jgi:ADP-ribose pyrophosphatase
MVGASSSGRSTTSTPDSFNVRLSPFADPFPLSIILLAWEKHIPSGAHALATKITTKRIDLTAKDEYCDEGQGNTDKMFSACPVGILILFFWKGRMAKPWNWLNSKIISTCRIFTLKQETYCSPRTGKDHDFYLLDSGDWVNVIPMTADQKVILVSQFRFGTKDFSLEIPGGMLDPGDSPASGASRELLEETGYGGDEPILLGVVHPNPAIHTNHCYTFLIQNAVYKKSPRQDSTEDIEVKAVPLADIPQLIDSGKITHALVIAAFYWLFNSKGARGRSLQGPGKKQSDKAGVQGLGKKRGSVT